MPIIHITDPLGPYSEEFERERLRKAEGHAPRSTQEILRAAMEACSLDDLMFFANIMLGSATIEPYQAALIERLEKLRPGERFIQRPRYGMRWRA